MGSLLRSISAACGYPAGASLRLGIHNAGKARIPFRGSLVALRIDGHPLVNVEAPE